MLCGPHLDTGSLGFRAVTFFIFFAVLSPKITKWRLCLHHGTLSQHSFRPGHRHSPEYTALTFAMSSTIVCVLLYLYKETATSQGSKDIGR